MGVKAGGAATFIDFQTRRLQVFGIPPSDLLHAGIVRPEDFDIRSAGFFVFVFVVFSFFFLLMRRGTHLEATWEWHFGVLWLELENK